MKLVLVQPMLRVDDPPGNLEVIERSLMPLRGTLEANDVVLLPEHFDQRPSRDDYLANLRKLAVQLGCHIVGGSHHEQLDDGSVNSGVVVDPEGQIINRYEKLRPYASERDRVEEGKQYGEIVVGDRKLLILICADFWFADVFERAHVLPDVVLVPALSVTRKPTPDYSRTLWQHLAVARAYEFGVYVGISDWSHDSALPLPASGVGGFADPTTADPDALFTPIGTRDVAVFELDFDALAAFRADRTARGFFWMKA